MRKPTRKQLGCFLLCMATGTMILLVCIPRRFVAPVEHERLIESGVASTSVLQCPFDVLVWNIYKGDKPDFLSDMRELSQSCDLLLLQEYHGNDRVKQAFDELPEHGFQIATSFLFRSDNSATGVATGSVASPLASNCFITNDTEPVSRTPKAMLVCRYPLAEFPDDLLVVNIHAINVAGFKAFRNQLQQIRAPLADHEGPVLLGGDFNTNTAAKQEYLRTFVQGFDLVEMNFENDSRMTAIFTHIPIDYVFTRGLATSQAEVAGSRNGSDHKAITFRIDTVVPGHKSAGRAVRQQPGGRLGSKF